MLRPARGMLCIRHRHWMWLLKFHAATVSLSLPTSPGQLEHGKGYSITSEAVTIGSC